MRRHPRLDELDGDHCRDLGISPYSGTRGPQYPVRYGAKFVGPVTAAGVPYSPSRVAPPPRPPRHYLTVAGEPVTVDHLQDCKICEAIRARTNDRSVTA